MLIFRVQISKNACLKTKSVRPRRRRGPGPGLAGRARDLPKTRFSYGFGTSRLEIRNRGHHPERNREPELFLVAVWPQTLKNGLKNLGIWVGPGRDFSGFSGFSGFSRNAPKRPRIAPNGSKSSPNPPNPPNSHYLGVPGPGLFFPFRAFFVGQAGPGPRHCVSRRWRSALRSSKDLARIS